MPFVSNMQDSEEQNPNQQVVPQGAVSPTGGGAAVRLSPSAAVPSTGGSGTPTSGSAPTPSSGGQFASLQNYLTANQGQATPLAAKVTPGINQQYDTLQGQTNQAIASINNQVTNAPGYTPGNPNVIAAESANPASFASSPANVASFQSLLNNTYGGPASAEGTSDYANQQNAINQAIATGQNQTTTEAGREQLLSQNEATPTTGVTALNSAILSQDPNALASVENAYAPFQNLLTGLSSQAQSVDQQIAKEQADAAASSQAAQNAITSQINALNTGVTGELTTAQQAAAAKNAQIQSDIQNLYGGVAQNTTPTTITGYGGVQNPWYNTQNYSVGNLSPTDLSALGITPAQWNTLRNAMAQAGTSQYETGHNFGAASPTSQVNLSQFLTQANPTDVINAANVATPEQYQEAQAFQNLLQGMNFATPSLVINPSAASQAGAAPTNLNTFDYQSAVNQANAATQAQIQAAQQEAQGLTSAADLGHAQSQRHGGLLGSLPGWMQTPLTYVANPLLTVPTQVAATKKKV